MMLSIKHNLPGLLLSALLLTACGGGGNGSTTDTSGGTIDTGANNGGLAWVEGEFIPYAQLANQCVADQSGSELSEKLWLRSWSNDTYLWYDEIVDTDPAPYTVPEYFELLKTNELSASGNIKDKFHYAMSSAEWEQLNQAGASLGYGFNLYLQQASAGMDRKVTVTFSEPNSPAALASIGRGAVLVSVDGVSIKDANDSDSINILNAGIFPSVSGKQTDFGVLDLGATEIRNVTLTATSVVSTPVPIASAIPTFSGNVGYIQFNAHIATAERQLVDAINGLKNSDVQDLVLDLRYNGGGLLALASQLGYMIAGEQATQNRTFERLTFNDKYPNRDPVTGEALTPIPFIDQSIGFDPNTLAQGEALPSLNLQRVFVLTTNNTCSASEALMNGLRGIDIDVIQIGGTSCGKPYGFYPTPNCDTTYFSVQFKGVNDKGFGDYSDGFVPSSNPTLASDLPGCVLNDDFSQPLGNINERLLSAALYYRDNNRCPALSTSSMGRVAAQAPFIDKGFTLEDTRVQSKLRNNRVWPTGL